MRTSVCLLGLLLLLIAAGQAAIADDQKKESPKEPQELTVVDYDSETHGALQVMSIVEDPVHWFDVLKDGKRAFDGNPTLLNNTHELAPGTYVAVVNRTERKVTIEAGKKTILLTGELVVEGKPDTAFWYPVQDKDRKVTSNPPLLNRSIPLFAGEYSVIVYVSAVEGPKQLGAAKVQAGKKTVLKH